MPEPTREDVVAWLRAVIDGCVCGCDFPEEAKAALRDVEAMGALEGHATDGAEGERMQISQRGDGWAITRVDGTLIATRHSLAEAIAYSVAATRAPTVPRTEKP